MKNIILTFIFCLIAGFTFAQKPVAKVEKQITLKNQIVDAACGECQFKMKGESCDLAIKVKGISYFVDGTKIDDHGDAHDNHGFCNAVRKAEVSGTVMNGRFKSTAFKLIPLEAKKPL